MLQLEETDDKYTLQGKVECDKCGGTGLYVGIAEKNGSAVICMCCNGTGNVNLKKEYKKFKSLKEKKNVKRVFKNSGGYILSSEDTQTEKGNIITFSKYGCTYKEWLEGKIPKPIESLHCPCIHTNQNMQNPKHKAYKLYIEKCHNSLSFTISDCKHFKNKEECWKRYHQLNRKEKIDSILKEK